MISHDPHPPGRRRRHRAPPAARRHARSPSEGVTVAGLVPPGHKVAVRAIAAGAAGAALQPDHRHRDAGHRARPACAHAQPGVRRLRARPRGRRRRARRPPTSTEPATFQGIVRADGRIATRNYIGVLTSVNCSATAARAIADQFRRDIHPEALAAFPNVDGVVALTHGAGCATDSEGEALQRAAPHARRLCAAPQLRRRAGGRPGLRDQPDPGPDGAGRPAGRRAPAHLQHPGHRRHRARRWRAASS